MPALDLYNLTRAELRMQLVRWGFSPVHAATVWRSLYHDLVETPEAIAGPQLPKRLRERLASEARIDALPTRREFHSADGFTRKFLLGLGDGCEIETVFIRSARRVTACVSSQAGCAMRCVFCATGQMGFRRNLSAGEIVAQAVHVARQLRSSAGSGRMPTEGSDTGSESGAMVRLRNIVLMGMGEPLRNYDAVMRAVDILRDPSGLALGAERITLSTVGVVPGILRLAYERRPLHLAVSLHAATQEGRLRLLPVARKWSLDELMSACRTYSAETGKRVFYEWTLIEGENDSPEQARSVGRLLAGLPAQVNLIPLNPTAGFTGAPTRTDAARRFQRVLAEEFSLPSTVRQRRGIDIAAGCGQLATGEGRQRMSVANQGAGTFS